jgi:hypothetical protein
VGRKGVLPWREKGEAMEAERVLDEAITRLTKLREETGAVHEAYRQRLAGDLRDSGEMADNERKLADMDIRIAALNDAIETVGELRWILLQEIPYGTRDS